MGLFSRIFGIFSRKEKQNVKIGLALGSGGAKGFAELGAIRAFEENGISFDMIAGTSIGSIIGAFIANGYSSTDIEELMKTINFEDIANTFMIQMDTERLFNVIDKEIGNLNIEELKKPFFAVSTEYDTGDEFVIKTGSVARAVCASSAMPPFFKPVIIDGKKYIDGAFSNSVPADVLKNEGANYVVGIDLKNHDEKAGFLSVILPTYQGKTDTPWEKGYKFSDVMLKPNLSNHKAISFSARKEMYDIGYNTALSKISQIKSDIETLKTKRK